MENIIITQAVFDRLEQELNELKNELRPQIVKRLAEARAEGDLKENGGYQAARAELRMLDTRIKALRGKIQQAEIIAGAKSDRVGVGAKIRAKIDGKTQRFVLGDAEFRTVTDWPVFSNLSPLGQSIIGRKVGETITYTAPNGKLISVEILKIESL
jgi:transcription elongation factor GreA